MKILIEIDKESSAIFVTSENVDTRETREVRWFIQELYKYCISKEFKQISISRVRLVFYNKDLIDNVCRRLIETRKERFPEVDVEMKKYE